MFERKTNRLTNYNYASPNYYFVTICAQNRKEYFGEILDSKMKLSVVGEIVEKFWKEIPNHYKAIELDQFVVMPNHLHAIIIIKPVEEAIGLQPLPKPSLPTTIGSFKNITQR